MSEFHRAPASADTRPHRRTVLQGAAGLVLAWMTPISASQDPKEARPAVGDWLVRKDDASLIPLTPDDVPFDGRALLAWPLAPKGDILRNGSPNNTIVLARLNPTTLSTFTRAHAVDDVVAYSAICTHSGCEVDDTLGDSHTLFCSCHGSIFDPRDGGAAIGGPAPRPLPSLPLKLVDGRLVVSAPFTAEPGFGF